ncbi:thermonuclease family protein [Mycoplasmopsis cricetuli]|uniref:thermonuclease family protein n=1 Tax=Mycoplasmopsis cricetuli TaxID=171283 RepID=UPI0004713F80|nr:thermonuclease family protein [Mycoplasmopsis cricetuli]
MKHLKLINLIFLLLIINSSCAFSVETQNKLIQIKAKKLIYATVKKIIDGDTLIVENENSQILKIRLYGIDTPEVSKEQNDSLLSEFENFWGQKAKKYLEDFFNNSVDFYYQTVTFDKYNRTVAVAYLNLNVDFSNSINYKLVQSGFARVAYITNENKKSIYYTKTNEQKQFYYSLMQAQQEAKTKQKGIWKLNEKRIFSKKWIN